MITVTVREDERCAAWEVKRVFGPFFLLCFQTKFIYAHLAAMWVRRKLWTGKMKSENWSKDLVEVSLSVNHIDWQVTSRLVHV